MSHPDPVSFAQAQIVRLERELAAWEKVLDVLLPPAGGGPLRRGPGRPPRITLEQVRRELDTHSRPTPPKRPAVRATAISPTGRRVRKRFPAGTPLATISAWRESVHAAPAKRKPGRPRKPAPPPLPILADQADAQPGGEEA